MAHFALVCPDDAGHLLAIGAVGKELERRGHRITLVAREKSAPMAERLEIPLHPLKSDGVPFRLQHLHWLAFQLFGVGWKIVMRSGFRWRAEMMLQLLPQALQEIKADGVLVDQVISAGGTAAERAGLPFVSVCSALLWNEEVAVPPQFTPWPYVDNRIARVRNRLGYAAWRWYMKPVLRTVNGYRRNWGLRPFRRVDDTFSPLAQLSNLCPGFDFPRRELPPHFHYVGSLGGRRAGRGGQDFPWDRLDGRPLIFASLGTISDPTNLPVFPRIAEACAGLDAQLVMTLGHWTARGPSARERLGTLPGDPLLVDFAPQLALLERASLLITHAGVNTVLEALERGVPMVALPRSVDQLGMGSRIEHAGVGLRASFQRSTAQEVRQLVERVLGDERFRRRARELEKSMIAAGGAERAADIAEEALLTRRPVVSSAPGRRASDPVGRPHVSRMPASRAG